GRPDTPRCHDHDKRRHADVYFPRGQDALRVEVARAQGRRGILADGSAYGCVFTGGATSNLLTFAMMRRPSGAGLLCLVSQLVVVGWVLVKCCVLSGIELARALLRRRARSTPRPWRVLRRVPEPRYDLYVLSDHGQAQCTPYARLSGGKPIEQTLFDDFLDPLAAHAEPAPAGRARRVVHGLAAYRTHRAPGFFQRFVNYLERDFPRVLGGTRGVREHGGIRVVSAGPNAF